MDQEEVISYEIGWNTDQLERALRFNGRLNLSEIPAGPNGTLQISVWSKNLTNEAYREFGIDFGALGFAMNTYGELRSYGVDLVYNL